MNDMVFDTSGLPAAVIHKGAKAGRASHVQRRGQGLKVVHGMVQRARPRAQNGPRHSVALRPSFRTSLCRAPCLRLCRGRRRFGKRRGGRRRRGPQAAAVGAAAASGFRARRGLPSGGARTRGLSSDSGTLPVSHDWYATFCHIVVVLGGSVSSGCVVRLARSVQHLVFAGGPAHAMECSGDEGGLAFINSHVKTAAYRIGCLKLLYETGLFGKTCGC